MCSGGEQILPEHHPQHGRRRSGFVVDRCLAQLPVHASGSGADRGLGAPHRTLSLAAASITVVRAGLGAGEELPIWISLTLLGAVTATLLLSRMRPTHFRHDQPS